MIIWNHYGLCCTSMALVSGRKKNIVPRTRAYREHIESNTTVEQLNEKRKIKNEIPWDVFFTKRLQDEENTLFCKNFHRKRNTLFTFDVSLHRHLISPSGYKRQGFFNVFVKPKKKGNMVLICQNHLDAEASCGGFLYEFFTLFTERLTCLIGKRRVVQMLDHEIECKDTTKGMVISQCFPIMHNKSHSFSRSANRWRARVIW